MKKHLIRTGLLTSLVAITWLNSPMVEATDAAGWIKNQNNWSYVIEQEIVKNSWLFDNQTQAWYYFGSDGIMATNQWIKDYYVQSNGKMAQSKWVKDKDAWYYVGNDGKYYSKQWIKHNQMWFYLDSDGKMISNQWMKIKNEWYHFNQIGKMTASQWVGDYYLQENGKMAQDTVVDGWYVDQSGKAIFAIKEPVNEVNERQGKETTPDTGGPQPFLVEPSAKETKEKIKPEITNKESEKNVVRLAEFNIPDPIYPAPSSTFVAVRNGGFAGQCTWYVYNRFAELGRPIQHVPMGNGNEWASYAAKYGYPIKNIPKAGYAVSFSTNNAVSDPIYGHVAFVEKVNPDGSIFVSEMNVIAPFVISTRRIELKNLQDAKYIDFGL